MLNIRSYPRAIVHIDGDCFFASCEIARDPKLRGKPVVTGRERGVVSSMSYEAKARGITRAMPLHEVKKVCPDAIIVPSDYESYSLYSKRMYEIVRRYTPDVEEYSIDECFADLTGLRRVLRMSYEDMAAAIKRDLDTELGMTFSIGLAPNKVLAKVASKWKKPSGLTCIDAIDSFLQQTAAGKIWGIGPQTTAHLQKLGITTALQFAQKDFAFVDHHFTKPHIEIWRELRGEFVYPLTTTEKNDYQSISKTRTFTPPSTNRELVFSQLSKNVENACIKLRRHNLETRDVMFFLKTQDFRHVGFEFSLSQHVSDPRHIMDAIAPHFDRVYRRNVLYRSTGVVFMKLQHAQMQTLDLFGERIKIDAMKDVYDAVDVCAQKFGKHTVFLGSSFQAMVYNQHQGDRGNKAFRASHLLHGETKRKRLCIPYLGRVI